MIAPGDVVEVAEGELINLRGKVIRVVGNKVTMIPDHEDLSVSMHHQLQSIRRFNLCLASWKLIKSWDVKMVMYRKIER